MHQAQIHEWGQAPKYLEVADPAAPSGDEVRIKLLATGVHQVVKSRASGRHYSATSLPHVPGVDGVGETDDGQLVYWFSMDHGTLSEYVNIPQRNVRPLPEGTDPIQAAGIVNPALSSWMAFQSRTNELPADFTVVILGATSASGRVAIQLARSLGARKVIGIARNKSALKTIGLDEIIVAADKPEDTDFSNIGDVDVILDYVYGPLAGHLLASLKSRRPTSYVHVGGLSQQDLLLPGAVIRSKNLTIRGSGPGAWAMHEMAKSIDKLLELVKDIPEQPVTVAKLKDVEQKWTEPVAAGRLVFVP
jgi:NADPH:quinone reductase-like Zn-dependent oxidoreductase